MHARRPDRATPPDRGAIEPVGQGLWARGHGFLYAYDLTGEIPSSPPAPGQVRRLQAADTPALRRAVSPADSRIESRLAAGRDCYGLVRDAQICSYCWVAYDDEGIGAFERTIRIGPGEAYIFDCVTLPAARGQGFYPAVLRRIVRELKARGFSLAWIGTDADNLASQHGIARAGFTRVVEIRYLRLLGWQRLELRPDPAAAAWLVERADAALKGGPMPA